MSDEIANLPLWVRRRDGSQMPFDADRICQSLFAAAESLGAPNVFLIRELTDAVIHFFRQDRLDAIPTTIEIAEEVEKIVREIGQPALARRYADQQMQMAPADPRADRIDWPAASGHVGQDLLRAYSRGALYSRDIIAAMDEGLLHLGGLTTPTALTSLVLETPRLAELPWWSAFEDWRAGGGETWIVESPEWLCTVHPHPALTTHLCERLLALPTLADRDVELHLNIGEPPGWSLAHQASPLFGSLPDDSSSRDRTVFLDSLLERWKVLDAPRVPSLAWHLNESRFREESGRQQLQSLLRLALQGKPIRFVFDRARAPIALSEGLDRRSAGVLLEVGLSLPAFAARPDIALDGAVLLKKLPSLARMAVSAAVQKRRALRSLAGDGPLKRGFLIERAACVVTPLGLDKTVRAITGESLTKSPLSLAFALSILQSLKDTLARAGRSLNLDLRLDGADLGGLPDAAFPPHRQLETAGSLHAFAGSGTATLYLADEVDTPVDALTDLLQWAVSSTGVVRLQLQRAECLVHQGELGI